MASQTVKRQRKRKRVDEDGDPEFQVAPMVDVLLVLMLFFMSITSTELLKKDRNLTLPDAKNAKPNENKPHNHEIIVNIAWDGIKSVAQFSMDGMNFGSPDDMKGALASRMKADPRAYVVLRADRDVQYSNVSDLMNACASVGIGTVTFAVITGGATDKKNPAAGGAASK
ncbi:MAG: biopolymer transporter ExbD [Methylacidiphilales bacterium]|nr:biopolymer transporter ExbD [Candidatus Methylacidiphilales bacterium]